MSKLTLEQKKLINDKVTEETHRCLDILDKMYEAPELKSIARLVILEIVMNHPFIKFNPELKKRIPE